MDPINNPYAPGAGTPPLELAGRDDTINETIIQLRRAARGFNARSSMLLGLRGVGKTVLLNHIYKLAREDGMYCVKMEAPENQKFSVRLIRELDKILLELDSSEKRRQQIKIITQMLRNFASVFQLRYEGFEFGATPSLSHTADFEADFSDIMIKTIEVAKDAGKVVVFFIDEIQYLSKEELAALVHTCHISAQMQLPFVLVGAGLPHIAKLAGDAKSYAERLFNYPEIGQLDDESSKKALLIPAQKMGVEIEEKTLNSTMKEAQNYPYFLQEWGSHLWNLAENNPITMDVFEKAKPRIQKHLDDSFFRVRLDRCKPLQQKYMRAMAELGPGPHKTGDIAAVLECDATQLSMTRSQLISLGMIWSQRHGETAFTVPLFDEFMKRQIPDLEPHVPKKRKI